VSSLSKKNFSFSQLPAKTCRLSPLLLQATEKTAYCIDCLHYYLQMTWTNATADSCLTCCTCPKTDIITLSEAVQLYVRSVASIHKRISRIVHRLFVETKCKGVFFIYFESNIVCLNHEPCNNWRNKQTDGQTLH
jgi:hypothetical protein